jgi:hypothetical protein
VLLLLLECSLLWVVECYRVLESSDYSELSILYSRSDEMSRLEILLSVVLKVLLLVRLVFRLLKRLSLRFFEKLSSMDERLSKKECRVLKLWFLRIYRLLNKDLSNEWKTSGKKSRLLMLL